jgi:GDPmannose 4,6-dehydratase
MTKKTALVTGITGQDGSYLSELLLEKDYTVVGLYRRSSNRNLSRISNIINHPNLILEEFDLTDPSGCLNIISKYQPTEFYNLAAQSHVGTSFSQPTTTIEINTVGVVNILEAIKASSPATRFYQASTSEMFGFNYTVNELGNKYQDEKTEFMPQSPYGVAKLASHNMVRIYRSAYHIHGSCGILFNHESPRRGENFVTRKITKYIGDLKNNRIPLSQKLQLGNLSAERDWGHAKDYVQAMWLMLQQQTPDDYVIATGQTRSVQTFLELAFDYAGLDYTQHVEINSNLYRPAEVEYLKGNANKAKEFLGWTPQISFGDLVKDMVDHDVQGL